MTYRYSENGVLRENREYKNGKAVSDITYDENGNLIDEKKYDENGKLIQENMPDTN